MENRQIELLLNKWDEIHKKITNLTNHPIQADFFEHFEQDMVSFLREFYRLKEQNATDLKAEKQHLEYDESTQESLSDTVKIEQEAISTEYEEVKKENNYPDIEHYFSLNDKFYFLREIFNENSTEMNQIINNLNNKISLNDSLKYMKEELLWDIESPIVIKLISIIEKRFENKKIWESYS